MVEYVNGASITAGSSPSGPLIVSGTMPQSSTVGQLGPILPLHHESAIAPARLPRPNGGRSPVTPHGVDGETTEPHVSVPMANAPQPADVAEAEPADEPLEPSSRFHGLRVIPPNHTS